MHLARRISSAAHFSDCYTTCAVRYLERPAKTLYEHDSMTVQFGLELLCGYIVTSFRHQREIELSLVSLLFTAEAHDEGQDCASLKISSSWAYRGSKRPRLRNIRARAHAVADKRS